MNRTDWTWKPISRGKIRRHMKSSKGYESLPWMPLKTKYRRRRTSAGNQSEENGIEAQEIKIIREDYMNCGFCDGSGEYPPTFTCPACKGQGELRIKPPAVICAYCRGNGKQKPRSQLTCLACKGKGVITIREPIEICSKCRGRGKERGNDTLLCIRCKGAGVVSLKDKGRKYMRKPSGTEGEVAEALYYFGGEASVDEIAPRIRVSTAYTEYVCRSMLDRGYLEKLSGRIYVLTPECEKTIEKKEAKVYEKVSDKEKEILRIVGDGGELTSREISQKLGYDFKKVKRLGMKMAKQDLLDLLTSGKFVLGAKGHRVLQSEEQVSWR